VDEIQETLYTYDYRGLVKTEINAAGDGKALIYDGNGNLIQKTDEDGYVTEYEYSPVNLVSKASYADGKTATYLYDGTGDLIRMVDWVGETTFEYDLLDRLLNVNDHNDRNVNYVYDNVGNTIAIQYPDGTQADYWYDAENQMVELADLDGGLSRFEFDPNGNVIYKEYPNNETAVYSYDAWNQLIELDEYNLGGKKHFKTTYTWDAEGNRLTEMQYNHGQTGKSAVLSSDTPDTSGSSGTREMVDALLAAALPNQADLFSLFANNDDPTEGVFALPGMDALSSGNNSSTTPGNGGANTGKDDATTPGNGDGNGQVPPGQTEDEEGGIQNPAGHYPPGLNRGKKPSKPENPDKPDKPENPGTEDKSDKKAQKGEHIYQYNKNGWVTQGTVAKETTTYTYDTLGNLVQEKCKNTTIDYQYNILNQLVSRTDKNDSVTFTYDKRGNRVAEVGKKATEAYVYDATNHLVEGTNWKGDKSAYTYNGLFVRVRNTQTTHAGQVYDREFVIDYNSFERNDLMVFSPDYYEQKHIYTVWGERMEQFTERGNWDRLLYVHEDIMGNTRYYTKDNGQSFAELEYDVWGAVTSPSKLNNNDNGNFAAAVFTGHPYDTVLDIYFAEARFYDANHRQWMASDPIKSGLNWYQYANGNPATYWDPDGLTSITPAEINQLKNWYRDGKINDEVLVKTVIVREAAGKAKKVTTHFVNALRGKETIQDLLYNSGVTILTKNVMFNALHTVAQITAAKKLETSYFSDTQLEQLADGKELHGRIDIIDLMTNHIFEVKPRNWLLRPDKNKEWKKQLDKYVQYGKAVGKNYILGDERPKGKIHVLDFFDGAQLYLHFRGYGDGKIGYYFSIVKCKPKNKEVAEVGRAAGQFTNETNSYLREKVAGLNEEENEYFGERVASLDEVLDRFTSEYLIYWNNRNTMERKLSAAHAFWTKMAVGAFKLNLEYMASVVFNEALEAGVAALLNSKTVTTYVAEAEKILKLTQEGTPSQTNIIQLADYLKEVVSDVKKVA